VSCDEIVVGIANTSMDGLSLEELTGRQSDHVVDVGSWRGVEVCSGMVVAIGSGGLGWERAERRETRR
jgi:hypothetical protein